MRRKRIRISHSGGVTPPSSWQLTVATAGSGKGAVTGQGIDVGSPWRGGPMIGMPGNGGDLATAGYEWFYNYTPANGFDTTVPFVPMVYDLADVSSAPAGASNEYLLTFNEPDANGISVSDALAAWPTLMATGRKLSCPATTTGATTWRQNFMNGAAANGYRVDFMAVHWYDELGNATDLRNYLNTVHANYNLPIWLTEFSAYNGTLTDNTNLITAAGPLLAALPFLKRVGWFTNRSIAGGAYANCGLVAPGGGSLTSVGSAYAAWPSHDDNIQTYADGTNVTLTATPEEGSTFAGWSGAIGGSVSPKTLTMDNNKSVTATFTAPLGGFQELPQPAAWYPTSVFNVPIPSTATVHTHSDDMVAYLLSRGTTPILGSPAGNGGTSNDFSHPVYLASSSDPLVTIHQTNWARPDVQIRIPPGAREAGYKDTSTGSSLDRSIEIIQPGGSTMNLWHVTSVSPTQWVCGFYGACRIDTDGLNGGITAAGYSLGLGMIRMDELIAGQINHASYCTVNGWGGFAPTRVYPSKLSGGTSGQNSGTWAPPQGAHLRLDPNYLTSSFLAASNFPSWKKTVLRSWRDYGLFVGDAGGAPRTFVSYIESETPYIALGQSPTNMQYLNQFFGHSGIWDIGSGVDWSNLQVLNPPSPP